MQCEGGRKAFFCQIDGWLNHLLKRELAEAFLGMDQTGHRAGHTGSLMGEVGLALIHRAVLF